MVSVMAPVLPHLVEEIHSHSVSSREQPPDLSVFANKWDFLVCLIRVYSLGSALIAFLGSTLV
jgi:hypothetical protein